MAVGSGYVAVVLTDVLAGLTTGLTLIIAIGAQNAFVLRQGLARAHVSAVVAVCAVSDAVLIAAGVAGIGTVIEHAGWVIDVVRWLGVVFLLGYGLLSLWRARTAQGLTVDGGSAPGSGSLKVVVLTALALTWLNPHVYLDTVLLLGSIANSHPHPGWFAVGAVAASLLWFTGLGFGARLLQPVLRSPRAWQVLDLLIGLVMLAIAAKLAVG